MSAFLGGEEESRAPPLMRKGAAQAVTAGALASVAVYVARRGPAAGTRPRARARTREVVPDKALVRGTLLRVCPPCGGGVYEAYIRPPSAVEPKLAFVRSPTNGVNPLYASPPEINA